ncbi:unnamed protein product, partial [Polarella glacialis]
ANYRGKEVCNIFTLWDYNLKHGGPPVFNKLNVESWRRRTHNLCKEPILINDDNVKEWIPDMPDEYFRMPAKAAKSDLIRYALLYHHGGLYMDADFIAIQDFEPIVGLLGDYELVSYSDKAPEGQQCDHGFSSNLLGGKKGSRIHKAIWEAQKAKMATPCARTRSTDQDEVCCPKDSKRMCNVPWAGIGEGVSHKVLDQLLLQGEVFDTFCFADDFTFVPEHFAYALEHIPSKTAAVKYMEDKGIQHPMDRIVYHMFNAITGWSKMKCWPLFNPRTFVGWMYNASFATNERGR